MVMRMRLLPAFIAVTALATSLLLTTPPLQAATGDAGEATIVTTQENGRTTRTPRAGLLTLNYGHNNEIYGSMVIFLRIKGITPPASEPRTPAGKK